MQDKNFILDEIGHDIFALRDNVDLHIIRERNREIRVLELQFGELAEISQDLAAMVYKDGEALEECSKNMESATEAVQESVENLSGAQNFANKTRGVILDVATITGGTLLGACGFLASPLVGVPTLILGVGGSISAVVARRKFTKS